MGNTRTYWALLVLVLLAPPRVRSCGSRKAKPASMPAKCGAVRRWCSTSPSSTPGRMPLMSPTPRPAPWLSAAGSSKQHVEAGEEGWVELEINTLSQPAGPNSWRVHVFSTTAAVTPIPWCSSVPGSSRKSTFSPGGAESRLCGKPPQPRHHRDGPARPSAPCDLRVRQFAAHEGRRRRGNARRRRPRGPGDPRRGGGRHPEGRHEEVVGIYTDIRPTAR